MSCRTSKGWTKALGFSLLLLSNNGLAQDCPRESILSMIDNFNNLASSLSQINSSINISPPTRRLSQDQIDRLAAEASDVVYDLFKTMGDTTTKSYRASKSDVIWPYVHHDTSLEFVNAPGGYRVAASWNDNAPGDAKQGIFAALYEPKSAGPVIFAFKGTITSDDWKEDILHQGGAQLQSLFRMLSPPRSNGSTAYLNLLKRLESGQDVLITGHSLGGGLAQATAYLLQRDLDEYRRREIEQGRQPNVGNLQLVTFNALGGQRTLKQFAKTFPKDQQSHSILYKGTRLESAPIDSQIDSATVASLMPRNYTSVGDPVSPIFDHIGQKIVLKPKRPRTTIIDRIKAVYDSGMDNMSAGLPGATMASVVPLRILQAVDDHSIKKLRETIDPDFKL